MANEGFTVKRDDFKRISGLTKNIDKDMIEAISDYIAKTSKYLDFLAGKEPQKIADRSYELMLSTESDRAKQNIFDLAQTGLFSMSTAFILLKMGKNITRKFWFLKGSKVFLRSINPSNTSENTEPYTQMVKRLYDDEGKHIKTKLFPCVISDESIYADDWCVVEHEYNEIV